MAPQNQENARLLGRSIVSKDRKALRQAARISLVRDMRKGRLLIRFVCHCLCLCLLYCCSCITVAVAAVSINQVATPSKAWNSTDRIMATTVDNSWNAPSWLLFLKGCQHHRSSCQSTTDLLATTRCRQSLYPCSTTDRHPVNGCALTGCKLWQLPILPSWIA